jgi:hypothetical protein
MGRTAPGLNKDQGRQGREKTYLVVNEGGEGEEVEQVREEPPHVGISVFTETLVIEPIHLCNLPRLVVPAKNCYSVAIAQLEGN